MLAATLVLPMGVINDAFATTLRFKPNIDQHASHLSDLLIIQNDIEHWANLPLDSHPKPGETITKDKLLDWMTLHIGHFNASWEGKTRIQVNSTYQSPHEDLIEKARGALTQRLRKKYTRIELQPISQRHDSEFALSEFKPQIHLTYPIARRVCVWLVHEKKKIPIWFKVKAFAPVLVAKETIHANTPVYARAFRLSERDIAGLRDIPAQSLPKQFWLDSLIARHEILLSNQIKSQPMITQGQHLKIFVHNPNITVAMDTIALSAGHIGDTITVKNPLNQNTFVVRITGAQQAEIVS